MTDTTRLKLPLLSASQALKHVTVNEALTMLDLLAGIVNATSMTLTAPAGGESDGTVYVLGGAGTGIWLGFSAGDLALLVDGGWRRVLPSTGMVVSNAAASGALFRWNGTAWVSLPTGSGWTLVRKLTDETRASTTTLANDGALSFAMAANTTYAIKLRVFFTAPATPGFKFGLVGPSSPTSVRVERQHRAPAATTMTIIGETAYTSAQSIAGNGTSNGYLEMDLVVANGASAGTFALQWAQGTSNGTAAAVLAGSTLEWSVMQ